MDESDEWERSSYIEDQKPCDGLGNSDFWDLYILLQRLLTSVLQIYDIPIKDRLGPYAKLVSARNHSI